MMNHPRGTLNVLTAVIALVAFIAFILFPFASHAQETPAPAQDRPTFSAGVALVPITAVVRDARSRLVRDLTRDDFQVLENNQPRQILDFSATDRGPVSLAILVDTSGSMRGPNLIRGKEVVERLLTWIDPGADEVALFTFDRAIRQETPFTNAPDNIRSALNTTDAWGLTSLYDAIADTAKRFGDRRSGRRAVIVITDGDDTSSLLTPPEVSGLASAIDVPVHVIAVLPPRPAPSDTLAAPADAGLSDLAYWTGGDLHHATSPGEANRVIAALMEELRQQYFLAIESSAASGWYRLDITTKRRNLTVRARIGYFATSSDPD